MHAHIKHAPDEHHRHVRWRQVGVVLGFAGIFGGPFLALAVFPDNDFVATILFPAIVVVSMAVMLLALRGGSHRDGSGKD